VSERTYADLSPDEQAKVGAELQRITDNLAAMLNCRFEGQMVTRQLQEQIRDACRQALSTDPGWVDAVSLDCIPDPEDPNRLKVVPGNDFTAYTMFAMSHGLRPPRRGFEGVWNVDSEHFQSLSWDNEKKVMHVDMKAPMQYMELTFTGEPHKPKEESCRNVKD
jgi:hypothetical protein